MQTFDEYLEKFGEIGYVEKVVQSLTYVSGLPSVKPGEIVVFESGELGHAFSLENNMIEVLTFAKTYIRSGERVARTAQELDIPVGNELLGRVVDPFCQPIDEKILRTKNMEKRYIHADPPGITERLKVSKQLETGVTVVDLMIPLGHGQRELIIGDRKTGKTSFLLQTALTQAKQGTICIYALIGKKKHNIKAIEEFFEEQKVSQNVIIVASSSQDPAGVIYITPFAAMTIAEYFKDQGKNVLLILDDLLTHAKFYREIALSGKRFPGRDSYPGDVFYMHAKLLERSGNFTHSKGESAITCLPVAETVEGELTGYVQTNLISMTDGHIYFDTDLFYKGRRPAVNFFLSVSRVGRQTQNDVHRQIGRELLSSFTLFDKLQNFIHFGAELSDTTKNILSVGETILSFFNQPTHVVIPANLQIYIFCLLWSNKNSIASPAQPRINIDKIIYAYKNDQKIAKQIDELVSQAVSFNALLGTFRENKNLLRELQI